MDTLGHGETLGKLVSSAVNDGTVDRISPPNYVLLLVRNDLLAPKCAQSLHPTVSQPRNSLTSRIISRVNRLQVLRRGDIQITLGPPLKRQPTSHLLNLWLAPWSLSCRYPLVSLPEVV